MSNELLSSRPLYEGWFDLLMLRIRQGTETFDRTLVRHPSGAAVLCYDPDRRVALTISELRAGVLFLGAPTLTEAIAGVVEDEDHAACARREAMEEGGVRLGALEPVGRVWMTPSSTTERVQLFLAAYSAADRVAAGGGLAEEGERLTVREVPLRELWAIADAGERMDAKTFMLLQALRLRRPDLF